MVHRVEPKAKLASLRSITVLRRLADVSNGLEVRLRKASVIEGIQGWARKILEAVVQVRCVGVLSATSWRS